MSTKLPPGVVPNYVNPPSEGWKVLTSTAVTLTFAIVFVILRLVVKLTKTHSPGWDDWFSVLALVMAIGRLATNVILVNRDGIGRDFYNIRKSRFAEVGTLLPAGDIIYIFGVMFAKLSLLILYYRIFGIDRKFRYVCLFVVIIVVGYGTSCGLAKIFICSPVKAGWDKTYKGPKHCADHIKIDFVLGWFSIFTDFAIFLMPPPMLWKLHLPRYKKLGLSIVFMFGAFACAMSIARQAFLYAGHDTKDSIIWNLIVFTLELNVGIICGCLPVIQPLLKQIPMSKYLPSSLRSYFAYKSKGSYRDKEIYVKQSNTTDPSKKGEEIGLREDKNPMVKDAGYPAKDSDEDLQYPPPLHNHRGGILRTDRFDVRSDQNV
ncbi:MAG: hypothetical protein Q9203_005528 [Teloschistes exilis]